MADKPIPLSRAGTFKVEQLVWDGITLVVMATIALFVYWWVVVK